MPEFDYKVRDKFGRHITHGRVEAADADSLIIDLQLKGYVVTDIRVHRKHGEKAEAETEVAAKKVTKFHEGVKLDDLTLFSRQLATLLEAGVILLKALDIIQEQLSSRRLYNIVTQLKEDISSGLTFKNSLARHPKIFSEFWLNLVETGEASGHLSVALLHMAKYLESKGELQRKIVSAMMYPIVLLVVMLAVLTIFLLKIVPIFSNLYSNFNVKLPALTDLVIHLSRFLTHYFIWIFFGIIGFCFLFYRYIHTPSGRWNFDKFILKAPVIGPVIHYNIVSRFANGLSTLIQSGVPILFALDIVSKSVGNKVVEKSIEEVRTSVKEGKTMSEPLKKSGYFPSMVVQMVSVGEEVGDLGAMLDKVYIYYDGLITTKLQRLTALFEPVMLVIMGAVVGFLVVSMYLPIFSLSSTVGR